VSISSVALGDVAEFIRGVTYKPADLVENFSDGSVVCMRTANVQKELDQSDLLSIPRELAKNEKKILREGDLLVSTANSWNLVGKCCWVPSLDYVATAGGFIAALRGDQEKVDLRYLYRWFSSSNTQANARNCGRQTTNISNMDISRCLALEIPLPAISQQRRIAAILDKADALRTKRRETIAKLDQLLQSVFLDMFGDPATNPKGWPVGTLVDLGELDRGVSRHRPRGAPELLGGKHPLIQTGDVSRSGGYIRQFTATYSDIGLAQSKKWPVGTLCITIAANIAETGILTFDACFPDSVVGFTPNQTSNVEFVQELVRFLREILEERAPQVAQKNINLAILRELPIPIPPADLQHQFARVAAGIEDQKRTLQRHAAQLDTLFVSLQHRAFAGEL
jgi:type I restriction enzyme S subunit